LVQENAVKTLYDSTSFTTVGQNLDDFLLERSDAVVLRGYTAGSNSFAMTESSEAESLDIYEWHKVYGALFNLEETANEQFEEAEARYQCNSDNAAYIAQQRRVRAEESEKPTVVWAYHSTYSEPNYWDVARCDEKNLYYCEFASRCASTLLHSNDGSIPNAWTDGDFHMNDEEFFAFAKDADHFIYTADNWDATFDKFKTELSEFKSVKNEEVYDTEGSGNGAWFEQRLAEFGKLIIPIPSAILVIHKDCDLY
jgi:ABC-type Fe3+-hydroxamate transport system substrate-binding protein